MWLVAVLGAVSLVVAVGPAPALALPFDYCASQLAEVERVTAAIQAHNAKPNTFEIPRQQAAYNAYNAEATKLDAERDKAADAYEACLDAMEALEDHQAGGPDLEPPTERLLKKITDARSALGSNWTSTGTKDAAGYWRVPPAERSLYKALRTDNPSDPGNVRLQGVSRPAVGAADPTYPGRVIGPRVSDGGPAVSADHIIPIAEIMTLKGFNKLTPENMYAVTRAPLNYQWLSFSANSSKSSRSATLISGADPAWLAQQRILENRIRKELEAAIQTLLKSQ